MEAVADIRKCIEGGAVEQRSARTQVQQNQEDKSVITVNKRIELNSKVNSKI